MIKINPLIVHKKSGDTSLMLVNMDDSDQNYYKISGVHVDIYHVILAAKSGIKKATLVDELLKVYEVDRAVLEKDVEEVLQKFQQHKVIEGTIE